MSHGQKKTPFMTAFLSQLRGTVRRTTITSLAECRIRVCPTAQASLRGLTSQLAGSAEREHATRRPLATMLCVFQAGET